MEEDIWQKIIAENVKKNSAGKYWRQLGGRLYVDQIIQWRSPKE